MAEEKDENVISTGNIILGILWFIFMVIWIISAIIGFYMSILCFSYNGTPGSKVAGFLLAIFAGPFFWLYYIFRSTYCTKDYYYPQ